MAYHNNYHHNNHGNSGHNNGGRSHNVARSRQSREERENRTNKERDNQAITSFTLGIKELEDKNAQFQYDKGWYSIIDLVGEEKNVIYRSKNAQEAYMKWNVYIGRKKERAQKADKAE